MFIYIKQKDIMKKILVLSVLALLGMGLADAQVNDYVPFVREGVKWVYHSSVDDYYHALELKGDTVIGGKTYKAMHKYRGAAVFVDEGQVPVYLREQDKVVYGIVPDGKTYDDCPIGIVGDSVMLEKIAAGEEFVLYDFGDPEGFIQRISWSPSYFYCFMIPDRINMAGRMSNRYFFRYYTRDYCMIEGIGFDGLHSYPLGISPSEESDVNLSHVIENGQVVYCSDRYRKKSTSEQLLSIPREGVYWVNERVVINRGDTTRSYYTYEFYGENYRGHPVCYTYPGTTPTDDNVSIAAIFQGSYDNNAYNVTTYDNAAYDRVVEEGRDMVLSATMTSGWYQLYQWNMSYRDISINNPVNRFIYMQRDGILTRENFTEVEPVNIEGMKCRRYAYVNESGEVQCYIIEGIGIDSRDMGDLLTPFTRKPDPDADYQEYCGLSHVIKDGQIIYKGMRYNAAEVQGLPYDVDGDGHVNITDVTALIDMLLKPRMLMMHQVDVDGNGQLNIADVTFLIDHILSM